jgi:hypothetical protein
MSSLRVACAVLLSIAAIGCGGGDVAGTSLGPLPAAAMCATAPVAETEANSVASVGETNDTTCASVVHVFTWRMDAAKVACASPLDCTPVCVACPDGKHHALAAWCDQGVCASSADVACMVAGSSLESCGFPSSAGTCPDAGVEACADGSVDAADADGSADATDADGSADATDADGSADAGQ